MRISLHSISLVAGAFALLLVTGCTDAPVVRASNTSGVGASNNTAPKAVAPSLMQCPSKQEVSGAIRTVTSADEKYTVYVVPDQKNSALRRVSTQGITVDYSFERVGPLVFRPDGRRFALIGRYSGKNWLLEFERGNAVPKRAEVVTETRNDWVCYSATGKYLFTLVRENKKWTLLSLELDSTEPFARYPLIGEGSEPSALRILPAHQKGWDGISFVVENKTLRLEIQTWLK